MLLQSPTYSCFSLVSIDFWQYTVEVAFCLFSPFYNVCLSILSAYRVNNELCSIYILDWPHGDRINGRGVEQKNDAKT